MTVWASVDALREVDLPRCAELEQELFQEEGPWTLKMLQGDLKAEHTRYYAARDLVGTVLGYAGLHLLGEEAEIITIGVDPKARRQGAGQALLQALLDEAGERDVYLEVRADNASAQALYEREGFEQVGVRKNYYRKAAAGSRDALVMCRPGGPGGEVTAKQREYQIREIPR